GGEDGLEAGLGLGLTGLRLELDEVRDCESCEQADDRDHDHELDEGKAFDCDLLDHWTLLGGCGWNSSPSGAARFLRAIVKARAGPSKKPTKINRLTSCRVHFDEFSASR